MVSRREIVIGIADELELPDKHYGAFLWLASGLLKEKKAVKGGLILIELSEVPYFVPVKAKVPDGRLKYVARTYTQELADAIGYDEGEYLPGSYSASGRPPFGGGSRQVAGDPGGYATAMLSFTKRRR